MVVGDVNGDGRPDLAVANFTSNNVSVLLGNGDGTFQPARSYGAGTNPNSVAVGDVNGDGRPDLAVANASGNTVSVLLGNGDGTFQPARSYGAGTNPQSVAVGDFNGDGRPDLAVANYYSNDVLVLLGNGDGTFQPVMSFDAGTNPISVAVGDINGDGRPDLAVANANSNNVSVLLGNGDGTFQPARTFGVGNNPFSVAVGDVNGDGRPDLAVANANSNNVSVLINNTALAPNTLTVSKAGKGSGTVASSDGGINCGATCSAVYVSGTAVTLTATPALGSIFTGWSGCDTVSGTTCTVTISAVRWVNASFMQLYALTVTRTGSGSGTVSSSPAGINCGTTCSASFAGGSQVNLTAVPAGGSAFTAWSGAGCSGTGSCVVTMNAAQSVVATFMVSGIDLIETAITNPPSSIVRKGSFSVTDTTMNQGAVAAGASTTRYYLSVDTQKSSNDILLNGSRAVPALASGASSTGTVTVTVPANVQSGTFFLLACSDDLNVVSESNEGNNCTASASQVTVTR